MLQQKNWPDKMFNQGCHFVGHWQILVGHCTMTDCYLQPCEYIDKQSSMLSRMDTYCK